MVNYTAMKKLFGLLAFVMPFLAVSCVESLDNVNPGLDNETKEKVTITLRTSAPTKTYLEDDRYVRWEEKDYVMINDVAYKVKIDPNDSTVAYVDSVAVAETYTAFYANTWYYLGMESLLIEIPSTQEYREGSFGQYMNAMVAQGNTTDLHFYNAASLLKIGILGDSDDVTLTSLAVIGNDGEPISGDFVVTYEQLKDFDSFEGVKYAETFNQYGEDNPTFTLNNTNVVFGEEGLKLSSTEPKYVYVVVPPQTYEKGITVTMADSKGRICMQSTDKSLTTKRSVITTMADFKFNSNAGDVTVEVGTSTATSVNFSGKSDENSFIRWSLLTKNVWEEYKTANPDLTEEVLAAALLQQSGAIVGAADGSFAVEATYSRNFINGGVALIPDTDYKILVSYSVGRTPVGTPVIKDARTAAGSGEAPQISVAYGVDENYRATINIYLSDNADNLFWAWEEKTVMDSLLAVYSPVGVIERWGGSADEEFFETDDKGRRYLQLSQWVEPGKDYSLLFMPRTADGACAIYQFDMPVGESDPNYPDKTFRTISTTAWMDCGLLSVWEVENFVLENITVQQAVGEDFFRIKNLHRNLNAVLGVDFCIDTEEDQFIYVDANDKSNIYIDLDYSVLYVSEKYASGFDSNWHLLSLGWATEDSATYPLGTYDERTGTVDFGALGYYLFQNGSALGFMPMESANILYLNVDGTDVPGTPPAPALSGLYTENFVKTDKIEW